MLLIHDCYSPLFAWNKLHAPIISVNTLVLRMVTAKNYKFLTVTRTKSHTTRPQAYWRQWLDICRPIVTAWFVQRHGKANVNRSNNILAGGERTIVHVHTANTTWHKCHFGRQYSVEHAQSVSYWSPSRLHCLRRQGTWHGQQPNIVSMVRYRHEGRSSI
jgi:hypothetical protein